MLLPFLVAEHTGLTLMVLAQQCLTEVGDIATVSTQIARHATQAGRFRSGFCPLMTL
jgi:hypothetical protein